MAIAMTVDELLRSPQLRNYAAMPEADALTQADALQEADLLDIRFLAAESSLAMLFDLRTSLQFRMANTAVMVLHSIYEFYWARGDSGPPYPVGHYVMSSRPSTDNGKLTYELVTLRGWNTRVVAASAEFIVGSIPDLPASPP